MEDRWPLLLLTTFFSSLLRSDGTAIGRGVRELQLIKEPHIPKAIGRTIMLASYPIAIALVRWLLACLSEAEIFTEERQDVVLETVSHCAGMRAGVELERVRETVLIKDVVKPDGIEAEAILIANIH